MNTVWSGYIFRNFYFDIIIHIFILHVTEAYSGTSKIIVVVWINLLESPWPRKQPT